MFAWVFWAATSSVPNASSKESTGWNRLQKTDTVDASVSVQAIDDSLRTSQSAPLESHCGHEQQGNDRRPMEMAASTSWR